MDTLIKVSTIEIAFSDMVESKKEHYRTAEKLANAKAELEKQKLIGLADGTIDGKNAELREASAREKLADLYANAEKAEAAEREARLNLDISQIEVDRLKTILRLAELHQKL